MKSSQALALIVCSMSPALAQPPEAEEEEVSEYGTQGQWEIGGSIGGEIDSDETTITGSPSVGYFVAERWQITASLNITYTREEIGDTGDHDSTTEFTFLLEPSYHHPIGERLQILLGIGGGIGLEGDDPELDVVPHVGLNILTAGSTVITPGVRVPVEIGNAHSDSGDELGTSVAAVLEVGITTTF